MNATTKKGGQTEITFSDNLSKGSTFKVGDTKYQVGVAGDEVKEGFTLLKVTPDDNGKISGAEIAGSLAKSLGKGAYAEDNKVIIAAKNGQFTDAEAINAGGITFQIGANGDADQRVTLGVKSMDSEHLGVTNINILTADNANAAIDIIDDAINSVSSTRADLGALQNRLEHTVNNLGTTSENLTAAESRIRDVDMAKEMMDFTKNNILTQAAQAMLAQANQQPQGVLQLLQ